MADQYPVQILGAWGGRAAYFGDDNAAVARKSCESYRINPKEVTGDVLVFQDSKKFSYGGYIRRGANDARMLAFEDLCSVLDRGIRALPIPA